MERLRLNDTGQLGDGTYNNINRPEQIVAGGVTVIAAGYYHSLFLKDDGSLWTLGGNNQYGQLGDGTYNQTNRPQQIVASNVVALPLECFIVSFLRMMAVCGRWVTMIMACWATALIPEPTDPSRLSQAASRQLPPEVSHRLINQE